MALKVPSVDNTPSSNLSEWNWSWSRTADEILNKYNWSGLAKACGAYKEGSQSKKDYYLPHHKIIQGKLTVVWGGVRAAMQRLKSTKIPATTKLKVYSHLASHYRHFNKKPPKYNEVFSKQEIDTIIEEMMTHD
jgi:hypothetical protein